MNSYTLFLALAFCATLIWRTEAEECGRFDELRCGNSCYGDEHTCTCGNKSWTGLNRKQGCCPSSPDSCIKDKKGKKTLFKKRNKNPNFFIPFIFTGNVNCTQGSVIRLGEKCPEIQQCLTSRSFTSKLICGDGHCSEEKWAYQICRGIPNVACTNE